MVQIEGIFTVIQSKRSSKQMFVGQLLRGKYPVSHYCTLNRSFSSPDTMCSNTTKKLVSKKNWRARTSTKTREAKNKVNTINFDRFNINHDDYFVS